jgi:hypothetical protein
LPPADSTETPMTTRAPLASSLTDKARIELNRLSMALSRCADQAECDRIMARMREKLPPLGAK